LHSRKRHDISPPHPAMCWKNTPRRRASRPRTRQGQQLSLHIILNVRSLRLFVCDVSDRKLQLFRLDRKGLSRYHLVNRNNRIITSSAKMGLTLTLVLFGSMACLNCDSYS
jgi:hypothetical protein